MAQNTYYSNRTAFAHSRSANTSSPEGALPDYKNMTTREVLEDQFARMDKQNAATTQQKQINNTAAIRNNPTTPQENLWDKALRHGEYFISAAEQGLSAGMADEIEGITQGLGYTIASLNKNWNKNNETFAEAYQRGYTQGRDYRRNMLAEGKQNAGMLMDGGEMIGAIANPLSKIAAPSKLAPVSRQAAYNAKNAMATGTISGIATVDNPNATWFDFAGNTAKNIAGNALGNWGTNKTFGKFGDDRKRNAYEAIINSSINNIK